MSDNGYDEDDETDSDSHTIVGKRATEVKLSLPFQPAVKFKDGDSKQTIKPLI